MTKWACEMGEHYSLEVFPVSDHHGGILLDSESAAWEHGLDCLIDRRRNITEAIFNARANLRKLKKEGR